jgi:hypothetical protein
MDCQGCDLNYIREEMPYVNYVREVRDAQVYLFIASRTQAAADRITHFSTRASRK